MSSAPKPQSVRFWTDDGFEVVLADDDLVEQLEASQQALRAYRAIFRAWEGHESITLNEEALRQWKSIAESALSNPASRDSDA